MWRGVSAGGGASGPHEGAGTVGIELGSNGEVRICIQETHQGNYTGKMKQTTVNSPPQNSPRRNFSSTNTNKNLSSRKYTSSTLKFRQQSASK